MEDFSVQHSDPGTERIVNAAICQFGREAFEDIDDLVTPSTFTINTNQIIYKCLRHIFNNTEPNEDVKLDTSLILATARTLKYGDFLKDPKEIKLIDRLFEIPIEKTNSRKFAAKIRKLEIRRLIYKQLMMGVSDLNEIPHDTPIEQLISTVEGRILDFTSLLSDDAQQIQSAGSSIDEYIDHVINNQCDVLGVSTGFPQFDYAIGGGCRRKAIQLIGARAKTGKSMLSINIGLHVASKLNLKILYLDTEMSLESQYPRMLANLAQVEINEIETGKFAKNKIKKAKVLAAKDQLKKIPFDYCSIAGKPFEEIFSIMRKWVTKTVGTDENGRTNDCLVIFDYIKLMDASSITKNMQEYQAIGFLMHALQNFCVKYDLPILGFVQLNRDGITKEGVESASGSDRIVWVCSSYNIVKRKAEEDLEECGDKYGTHKLIPIISRYGGGLSPGDYINLHFNGKTATFKEGKTYFDVKRNEQNSDYSDIDKISENLNNTPEDNNENIVPWE